MFTDIVPCKNAHPVLILTVAFLSLQALAGSPAHATDDWDSSQLVIQDVTQYFFDDGVIAQTQDLTRTVHRPTKAPGPCLQKDKPWERTPHFHANNWSILRDSANGQFRCWYEDWYADPDVFKRDNAVNPTFARTLYAQSTDGLHWEKPALDYYEENGQKTNAVLGDLRTFTKCEGIGVFEDPLDPDPQRRFKMALDHVVGAEMNRDARISKTRDGRDGLTGSVVVEMHASADGVHWKPLEGTPRFGLHGNNLGDCFSVFPDSDAGQYRLLTRAAGMESVHYDAQRPQTNSFFPPHFPGDPARMNKRRIFLSGSADLIRWSSPRAVLTPDSEDNLDDSYYCMNQFKVGEMYVGFLHVLHEVSNTLDVRLVFSRDGWHWHQMDQRRPWLAPSGDGWDKYMVNANSAPIAVGDEMFVFFGGASCRHDWWFVGKKEGLDQNKNLDLPEVQSLDHVHYGLGLAKMRRDGFVSLDAGLVREGVLVTNALRTGGHRLVVNAACAPGGYVKVEATDENEKVLNGCSRELCTTFTGDATQHVVAWKDRPDIPHDGVVRLRFFLRNASLYSFKLQ